MAKTIAVHKTEGRARLLALIAALVAVRDNEFAAVQEWLDQAVASGVEDGPTSSLPREFRGPEFVNFIDTLIRRCARDGWTTT